MDTFVSGQVTKKYSTYTISDIEKMNNGSILIDQINGFEEVREDINRLTEDTHLLHNSCDANMKYIDDLRKDLNVTACEMKSRLSNIENEIEYINLYRRAILNPILTNPFIMIFNHIFLRSYCPRILAVKTSDGDIKYTRTIIIVNTDDEYKENLRKYKIDKKMYRKELKHKRF